MIRGLWSRDTIGWMIALALLPPAAVIVVEQGAGGIGRMGLALIVSGAWAVLFRALHGAPLSPTPAVMAVAVAVMAPQVTALDIAIGVSFGIVLAELIFGGWGRNVISAPVAALAMLYLNHPGALPPPAETTMVLAALVSGVMLAVTGILSLTVTAGAIAGAAVVAATLGAPLGGMTAAGAFALGLVFLIGDPVAAPVTRPARIAYGLLAGGLAALIAGPLGLEGAARAVVFAALIAQIFAPAFDTAGIALYRTARSRRHV